MRLVLLCVGRLRPYYREACDDYRRRLSRFATIEEIEVREAGRRAAAGQQPAIEAQHLLKRLPQRATTIALTRDGSRWSSRDLASRLDQWMVQGGPLAFVVGGSDGLGTAVLDKADETWSLGPLTLPHELARVIVYEQLYRGYTILKGMPYHKGGAP